MTSNLRSCRFCCCEVGWIVREDIQGESFEACEVEWVVRGIGELNWYGVNLHSLDVVASWCIVMASAQSQVVVTRNGLIRWRSPAGVAVGEGEGC